LALGESGVLYSWGKGEYGVLGIGSNRTSSLPVSNPILLEILRDEETPIKTIHSCFYYSAAHMEDGRVFMWGRNDDGQFGVGNSIGMDMYESEKWPIESNLKD